MPSNSPSRAAVVVTVIALGVVVAGAVVLWPADAGGETAEPHIGHNASERLQSLDGLNATVETTLVRGNETTRSVREVSLRPGARMRRAEVVSGTGNGTGNRLVVSNGTATWIYDREASEVTKLSVSGSRGDTSTRGRRIEQLFNRLNISRSNADESESAPPSSGLVPLPTVPAGGGGDGAADAGPEPDAVGKRGFGVRYEGTGTVDGRETYVLTVTAQGGPSNGTFSNYSQTIHVDTEWFLPLRTHTEWRLDGHAFEVTTVYRNVTFEPGLSDSLFTFDPPADATVREVDGISISTYDSVSALRANVSAAVPEPAIPESFELTAARAAGDPVRSVTLQYANATSSISVQKTTFAGGQPVSNGSELLPGDPITVAGNDARYRQIATNKLVTWTCEGAGHRYSVIGNGVTRDRLFDVAESVGCSAQAADAGAGETTG
jgi:outer membrane lipoprotein-sorting protein